MVKNIKTKTSQVIIIPILSARPASGGFSRFGVTPGGGGMEPGYGWSAMASDLIADGYRAHEMKHVQSRLDSGDQNDDEERDAAERR